MSTAEVQEETVNNKSQAQRDEFIMETIFNAMNQRHRMFGKMTGDLKVDYNTEIGVPDTLNGKDFENLVERNGMAEKAVGLYPNHVWKSIPQILENSEAETTPFEAAFEDLHSELRINNIPSKDFKSHFRDNEASPIWDVFKRAMRLANIAEKGYSVIMLGFSMGDDETKMEEAVKPSDTKKLLYMTPLIDTDAEVATWYDSDEDKSSPLYRKPKTYNLRLTQDLTTGEATQTSRTVTVHHSRVIHICRDPKSSEITSESLLQNLYDCLIGTRKVIGASPEGYWKMAFTKMLLEADPDVTMDDVDVEKLRDNIFKWEQGLQSSLSLFGMKGKAVPPNVVDPSPFMNMLIEWIAATLDCPYRIFRGSERGELASSQDKQEWNETVAFYQARIVSPYVIAPFIDRLIWARVLPEPPEGYYIEWPELNKQSRLEAADVTVKRVEAMVRFVQGGVADSLMSVMDFFTRELGYTQEEAQEIIENFEPIEPLEEDEDDDVTSLPDEGIDS